MNEVEGLTKRLVEKDIFIESILKEMKEIYELMDNLKYDANSLRAEFSALMKSFT